MRYCEEYQIDLPERSDTKYFYIENYEDYEYTYCVAYEMLIRTKEFKTIKEVPYAERGEQWKKEISKLGLNPNMRNFPENIFTFNPLNQNQLINETWTSFIIDDIQDGLNRLITFYINRNELYQIKRDVVDEYGQKIYKKVKNTTLSSVIENMESYHIPTVINNQFAKNDTSHIQVMSPPLSKYLPLKILEKRFLEILSSSDLKEKYIQTEPIFNRPRLVFQQSKIINLPVNLNLKKEELVAYMSKIKDDYDKKTLQILHPLERIARIFKEAKKPNSEKKLPMKRKKRKAMADAFYIYDLYQIIEPIWSTKNNDSKIDLHLTIAIKSGFDENSTYFAENGNTRDGEELKKNDKVEKSYTMMREYIEGKKYRELITGVAIT